VVIGDGHLRSLLEAQARELGLEDDVRFVGSRRDLETFYPALDIVALTSRNEGTPLTLIEAMACARPVIATTVGGVVDLIGEPLQSPGANDEGRGDGYRICERGMGVCPGDVDAFVSGLARLASDAALRREMGERGRVFVQSKYSKKRLVTDIKNLYDDLLLPKTLAAKARDESTMERRASEQAVRTASLKGD